MPDSPWIPTHRQLPPPHKTVLVLVVDSCYGKRWLRAFWVPRKSVPCPLDCPDATIDIDGKYWIRPGWYEDFRYGEQARILDRVTHWRELPVYPAPVDGIDHP